MQAYFIEIYEIYINISYLDFNILKNLYTLQCHFVRNKWCFNAKFKECILN